METNSSVKERLLETAYKLFYAQGYNLTGINQILEESKVAKASLYQNFRSKEDLGIEYIKKVRNDWFEAFEKFIGQKQNPEDKILAAFDFLETNATINDFRGCRFLNLLSDIETTSKGMQVQIVEHKSKLRSFFKVLVADYLEKKGLDLPNLSDSVYLLFEAAVIESKVYRDVWPIVSAKQIVKSMLKI